jgi:hypothetical protein
MLFDFFHPSTADLRTAITTFKVTDITETNF